MARTKGEEHRDRIRKRHFAGEDAWTGENEKGWFRAPRTLPLVLSLIASKAISGKYDLSKVYLELWARHMSGGVIEMREDAEHAYAAGYRGPRATHTWHERMKLLEKNGIIKTKGIGLRTHKYVLLVHPTAVVEKLRQDGKVSDEWLDAYKDRQLETKEDSYHSRKKAGLPRKVVPIKAAKTA